MKAARGFPIVLTADRTLMAAYPLLFDGVLVANQTTRSPSWLIRALMMPRGAADGVRARLAPLGLRRIEAALVAGGFERNDVAVVSEVRLGEAIGPATRVVGVSAGEPCGLGMSTTTTVAIAGGSSYPAAAFRRLMKKVRRAVERSGSGARVAVGGPGAWQLAGRGEDRAALGIDCVITGYAEGNAADLFRRLAGGEAMPETMPGEGVDAERVPRILGASTMGVVELSRGCGLGCVFCTMARVPMKHLPEATILADAETNLAAGQRNLCLISEDIFRFGASVRDVRPEALLSVLARLRERREVGLIQTDHGNLMSVARYSDAELAQVRELMVGGTGQRHPWVNVGVETASGALLESSGGGPKMGGVQPERWAEFCSVQLRRLCGAGFLPVASLVVGLPGETEPDVRQTIEWAGAMADARLAIFPVLYAPIDGSAPVTRDSLTGLQWRLVRECYTRFNFRQVPGMYWDGQRAAGVGLAKRLVMAGLGRCQMAMWRVSFALGAGRGRGAG